MSRKHFLQVVALQLALRQRVIGIREEDWKEADVRDRDLSLVSWCNPVSRHTVVERTLGLFSAPALTSSLILAQLPVSSMLSSHLSHVDVTPTVFLTL